MSLRRAARRLGIALAAALVPIGSSSLAAAGPIDIYQRSAPAVVRVQAALQGDMPAGRAPTRLICTGFFITRGGRVLTFAGERNELARASRIWIEKDGLPYLAELVGTDPRAKVALLQVVKLPAGFDIVSIEPPAERPSVGTPVLAISSPLSIDTPSPSHGLIAGYESNFGENVFPFTYARVTVPSGDAESGSPVLDHEGRLIGLSVASLPQYNSSYLVPTRALARLVEDFDAAGRVTYGSLPIECDEHADTVALTRLVVVGKVLPDSSASRAGLRVGDAIRRIDGVNIRRIHDYRDALFFARVGQYLQLEVERDGRTIPFVLPVEASVIESAPITAPPPLTTSPAPPAQSPPPRNAAP